MPSCSNSVRRAKPLLGTFVEIRADSPLLDQASLQKAVDNAFAAIETVQRLMSYHDPASDLSRLNRLAFQEPVVVHAWTRTVLEKAVELNRLTGGLFDPAIGPRLEELGYLPIHPGTNPATSGCSVRSVRVLDDGAIRYDEEMRLDLGGIAKGFAVDKAIETLAAGGVTSAVVNAGGDLRVFGAEAHPLHVRNPSNPGSFSQLDSLKNAAAATSSDYFARKGNGRNQVNPIIHPFTTKCAPNGGSITVKAPTCLVADALTKAVALAGPSEDFAWLEELNAEAWFIGGPDRLSHAA